MEERVTIAILEGTTRLQRRSIHVARLVESVGKRRDDINTIFVDPVDFNFPGDGNDEEGKDPRYTKITEQADGFFIVTPEYNHSFPGSLKRMLDSESNYSHYIHKPVTFAGVSEENWGGVRAVEALVVTVREMGMVATFSDIYFPKVSTLFDESGTILDAEAATRRINRAYDELVWMARTLKWGREHVSSQYHQI